MRPERFEVDGELLAVRLGGTASEPGFLMASDPELPLQVGRNVCRPGHASPPHVHPRAPADRPPVRHEMLHVLRGKMRLTLFTTAGKEGPTLLAETGDTFLLTAGHATEFLEETELLEVKEGPYPGKEEDKQWLR